MRTGGEQQDERPADGGATIAGDDHPAAAAGSPRWWWIALAGIVLVGLVLRLWGIRWGLPFGYNLDERSHFVPRAVEYFRGSSLDPDYQLNPSGLIEWIAAGLWLGHWSSDGIVKAWATDPADVWTIARVASALLSTAGIALLYAAGARLFDRRVGLLAAAILATAFLPTHYGHLALNDAPSLAPTGLALFGIAGIVRYGRRRDYLVAGIAIGIAVGFKYNAAFVLLPMGTAAVIHALGWRPGDLRGTLPAGAAPAAGGSDPEGARDEGAATRAARGGFALPHWRPALLGLVVAAIGAAVAFFLCDPYAILRPGFFVDEVQHLSEYTKGGLLLGETQSSGYRYYGWSLLWGFGLLPLLLAVVGGLRLLKAERWQALLLIPAPLLFFAYVGSQGRYFARYGMPVYPILALLAAAGGVWLGSWLLRRLNVRGAGLRLGLGVAAAVVVVAQGLIWTVHNDVVLSREDTRSVARDWMVKNVPAGSTIVVEPMMPKEWYADGARLPNPKSRVGYRWNRLVRTGADKAELIRRYPRLKAKINRRADFANNGYTLFPGLLNFYREKGACWIVSGSMQSGRVMNNPARVPEAARYYRALDRQADVAFQIAPFDGPSAKHYFQYDLAFNFGPLRYERPGPSVRVYRLRRCTPRIADPAARAR
ncbi:Tetratricopeptide TPR_2 repeat protein [Patulibacter medicamentivorans]|uniref:Tetratricopeptide TPR_2 repeat protein n=1 Tax=Patulibacter medicamentivorans TaxID=1097667 RepID=H0EBU8_9ACTN|nr:glycosyltransferase family 39 protein [Patulibacter medicamentivorans]EHN08850.1 Tetratricopeptide TPR_2 repeat protein [Patulibacter medicamentivorans]